MGWEVARRYLAELTRKRGDDDPVVQVVLIVDVGGSGMSNLELELLPMMLDLLKSHYPSMVGCSASNLLGQLAKGAHLHTVFVMNFGWAYAGMFAIVKRVLPKPALERMLFPNKADLLQFFNNASLLEGAWRAISANYANSVPQSTAGRCDIATASKDRSSLDSAGRSMPRPRPRQAPPLVARGRPLASAPSNRSPTSTTPPRVRRTTAVGRVRRVAAIGTARCSV
jgi:hypothetical protein